MSAICPTGHRPKDKRLGDACDSPLWRTDKDGKHVRRSGSCREKLIEEPALSWCGSCDRGLYVEGWCSFCAAPEALHGEDFGCSLCGTWFPTLTAWQEHVYGPEKGYSEFPAQGCRPPKIGVTRDTVSPGQKGVRRRKARQRDRNRDARVQRAKDLMRR